MANFMDFKLFKSKKKSYIIGAIIIKFNVHIHVMTRHHCFKFHEIPYIGCLVMTKFVDYRIIKNNNLCPTEAILTNGKMKYCIMMVHTVFIRL